MHGGTGSRCRMANRASLLALLLTCDLPSGLLHPAMSLHNEDWEPDRPRYSKINGLVGELLPGHVTASRRPLGTTSAASSA